MAEEGPAAQMHRLEASTILTFPNHGLLIFFFIDLDKYKGGFFLHKEHF